MNLLIFKFSVPLSCMLNHTYFYGNTVLFKQEQKPFTASILIREAYVLHFMPNIHLIWCQRTISEEMLINIPYPTS